MILHFSSWYKTLVAEPSSVPVLHRSPEAEQRPFEAIDSPIKHVDFQAILVGAKVYNNPWYVISLVYQGCLSLVCDFQLYIKDYQGISYSVWCELEHEWISFPNSWDDLINLTNSIIFQGDWNCWNHQSEVYPLRIWRLSGHKTCLHPSGKFSTLLVLMLNIFIYYIYILYNIYIYIYYSSCCRMKFLNCRWFTHHCW